MDTYVKLKVLLNNGAEIIRYHKTDLIQTDEILMELLGNNITENSFALIRTTKYLYDFVRQYDISDIQIDTSRYYNEDEIV